LIGNSMSSLIRSMEAEAIWICPDTLAGRRIGSKAKPFAVKNA
jgi:hypothetical protein